MRSTSPRSRSPTDARSRRRTAGGAWPATPLANIAEHAFGKPLAISAFPLADGRKITVKNGWRGLPEEQGFLRDVQAAACDQFRTGRAPRPNAASYCHIT